MRSALRQSAIQMTVLFICLLLASFGLYELTKVSAAGADSEKKAQHEEEKADKKHECQPGGPTPPGNCVLKTGLTFPTPFPPNTALKCTGGSLCADTNFVCNSLTGKKCKNYITITSDSQGTCSCGCG
jgi:hypothetical protein